MSCSMHRRRRASRGGAARCGRPRPRCSRRGGATRRGFRRPAAGDGFTDLTRERDDRAVLGRVELGVLDGLFVALHRQLVALDGRPRGGEVRFARGRADGRGRRGRAGFGFFGFLGPAFAAARRMSACGRRARGRAAVVFLRGDLPVGVGVVAGRCGAWLVWRPAWARWCSGCSRRRASSADRRARSAPAWCRRRRRRWRSPGRSRRAPSQPRRRWRSRRLACSESPAPPELVPPAEVSPSVSSSLASAASADCNAAFDCSSVTSALSGLSVASS